MPLLPDLTYASHLLGCSQVVSFIINSKCKYSVSLSSVGLSSKLLNLRWGVMETGPRFIAYWSDVQWPRLAMVPEVGGKSPGTEP